MVPGSAGITDQTKRPPKPPINIDYDGHPTATLTPAARRTMRPQRTTSNRGYTNPLFEPGHPRFVF